MTISKSVVFGFAMCGVYSGGAGLPHIRALQELDANHAVDGVAIGSARLGDAAARGGTRVRVVAALPAMAVVVAVAFGHLRHPLASLEHMGMVLGGGLVRSAARDLLLVGSGLSILLVLGFVVFVAELLGSSAPHRPGPLRVVALRSERVAGTGVRSHLRRPRKAARVARRPPTIISSRPATRPVLLKPVLGRLRG